VDDLTTERSHFLGVNNFVTLPRSNWGVPTTAERKVGTKVKFAPLLHCPFDTRTMLSENTARMGDEGKAVGT